MWLGFIAFRMFFFQPWRSHHINLINYRVKVEIRTLREKPRNICAVNFISDFIDNELQCESFKSELYTAGWRRFKI